MASGKPYRVAIVVDSAASLPPNASELGPLFVVPLQLVIDGKTYRDGIDITPTEFYKRQQQMTAAPTTSAPAPATYLEAFKDASAVADTVLCLTVSQKVSATHNSATAALTLANDHLPEAQITVLDTESAAGGEGLVVTAALHAAAAGAVLPEVVASARNVVERVYLVAYLDTLFYVWKSGRVPVVAHWSTSLLQIKPLFELKRGEVKSAGRMRTARKASEKLMEILRERATGRLHATVMHANVIEEAERFRRSIQAEFDIAELFVSEFSPVMGSHTGPGLVGISFYGGNNGKSHTADVRR